MCGIIFIKSKKKIGKNNIQRSILDIISRGPNYQKKYYSKKKKTFFLNSVLQITGSERSKYFRISKKKKIILAFNGQIYNFKTLSIKFLAKNYTNDTDFLLDFLDKYSFKFVLKNLNGMFSILVLNLKKDEVYIANDPQGEKRLFYYRNNQDLIISSTPVSILKYLKDYKHKLNIKSFNDYFCTRHFVNYKNFSFYDINILEPGKFAKINLKNFKIRKFYFDNPINWINKNQYLKINKLKKNEYIKNLNKLLLDTIKNISSTLKTGCTISAGIDSSLSSSLLEKIKDKVIFLCLQFPKKDPISAKIANFKKYFRNKIYIKKVSLNNHKFIFEKIYKNYLMPFFTHDFVARYITGMFFKNKKVKIFYVSDAADELFGGYEKYKNIINNPISPYSYVSNHSSQRKNYQNFFLKVEKKYNFIKNKNERKIMTSLFLDYFYQSVSVTNLSNDLIGSSFGLEVRNIFSKKEVIKFAINTPISKKFYLNSKFELKPSLKSIFEIYMSKKLIFKKQGLSGYPNEMSILADKDKIDNLKKYFSINKFELDKKAYDWKILNIYFYFKYLNMKKINYDLYPSNFRDLIKSF